MEHLAPSKIEWATKSKTRMLDSTTTPVVLGEDGTSKPSRAMSRTDKPRLGDFGKLFEKYAIWLAERHSPPSSPILKASSQAIIVEGPATSSITDAPETFAPSPLSPLSSDSEQSDGEQSLSNKSPSSSHARELSTPLSSPPLPDDKSILLSVPRSIFPSPLQKTVTTHVATHSYVTTHTSQLSPQASVFPQPYILPPPRIFSSHVYSSIHGEKPDAIAPTYWSTKPQKQAFLLQKLMPLARADAILRSKDPVTAGAGIHVFVDLSNIVIGFYNFLKLTRGIPVTKRIPPPPFSFENLALVLERNRPAIKKIVAGSLVKAHPRRWPQYMQEAENCGYEMNILQRVPKNSLSPNQRGRRFASTEQEWTTSGGDSSDDPALMTGTLKRAEQGVDELLHLKMVQSLVDCADAPGTIVLATGDAAAAEFSDGFKSNVERALNRGWTVELYAWTKGTSSSWKDAEFNLKWGDKFKLFELDPFVEELFGVWLA